MNSFVRAVIAAAAFVLISFGGVYAEEVLVPKQVQVPPQYFGQHMHRATSKTAWPTAPFGAWRLWDCYAGWAWIEPRKGGWQFEQLDRIVALAEQHGVELLLPLGPCPQWASARPLEKSVYGPGRAAEPKDMADWRNYVRTVATRYKGKIRQYEIWNEPNLKGFFSGSVPQIVTLTKEANAILKEVDPRNILVSPAATGGYNGPEWLDQFLAAGGGKYCDVIGFHTYVSPAAPETMVPLVARVRAVMKKHGVADRDLWNTEAGWFIQNEQTEVKPEPTGYRSRILTQEEGAAYVTRALLLDWAAGVDRFYWYAWDNEFMGMTEPDGKTVKLPGHVFARTYGWLQGRKVGSCRSDSSKIWTCTLVDAKGDTSWIAWAEDGTRARYAISGLGVKKLTTMQGEIRDVSRLKAVDLDFRPVLLQK